LALFCFVVFLFCYLFFSLIDGHYEPKKELQNYNYFPNWQSVIADTTIK